MGSSGTIIHSGDGGVTWAAQVSGTTKPLMGVCFIDTTNGWVVGRGGIIRHTANGGATWAAQTSGTQNNLYSVSFEEPDIAGAAATEGFAVGAGGVILRTENGGTAWQASNITPNTLFGVFMQGGKNICKCSLNQVCQKGNRTQINTEGTQMNADLKYKELTEKIIEESLW